MLHEGFIGNTLQSINTSSDFRRHLISSHLVDWDRQLAMKGSNLTSLTPSKYQSSLNSSADLT